ncbi:aldo/keto reductase [Candidatus Sumerlaeota bacterium]|nr:aldo/keto reductase [Candidatus Sumerlaeota bacterium]
MLYRDFGKTGWKVSVVGFGAWNIGNQWGEIDDATSWATIRAAYDHGMNLFDTAESYGNPNGCSEERLGVALAGIRHQTYIVTKVGNWGKRTGQSVPKTTVDMIRLCCHASLHRLRTDWVDVLLCHEGSIQDPSVYLEAFEVLKKEGRVRAYGISTNSIDVLKKFNAEGNCSVLEIEYSLINRAPEKEVFPYCQEHGIGILIRGPLAKGLLSGRYDASTVFTDEVRAPWSKDESKKKGFERQIAEVEKFKKVLEPGEEMVRTALRFSFSHPSNPVTIPGAKSPEQAAMNAAAGDRALSAEEIEKMTSL